jgi:anti-sigma factor RsiW
MNHERTKDAKDPEDACGLLDHYLDGELTGGAASDFESHLACCPTCAAAADEQRWIEGLLRSPAAAALESAPKSPMSATMIAIVRRRRVQMAALGAALAASLALLAAWPHLPFPGREGLVDSPPPPAAESFPLHLAAPAGSASTNPFSPGKQTVASGAAPQPAANIVSTPDAIAVPLDSPAADVTVVQVYTTVDAQRRQQLAATLASISSKPNGG